MKLSKIVWSLVTNSPVFRPLLISRCTRRFRRNPFLPVEIGSNSDTKQNDLFIFTFQFIKVISIFYMHILIKNLKK